MHNNSKFTKIRWNFENLLVCAFSANIFLLEDFGMCLILKNNAKLCHIFAPILRNYVHFVHVYQSAKFFALCSNILVLQGAKYCKLSEMVLNFAHHSILCFILHFLQISHV